MLSFEQIKELIELVASHRLDGLELERSGFKLTISGHRDGGSAAPESTVMLPAQASAAAPVAAPAAALVPGPAAAPAPAAPDAHLLKSPIVGTFYASPAPDAEPYVRIGDHVKKGQVLCIVEAMKLMNEIESDADGEVVQVFPKNAQPVEYGETLFAIKAS